MSTHLASNNRTAHNRCDDGEQQPISAVERDFGAESHGKRHGLEIISALVQSLGNPHQQYPTIHVAGSKGKGSTVAMLSAILSAAGYRTGTYTSPSLTQFGERIQIDGQPIQDSMTESIVAKIREVASTLPDRPRFFEAATALAFQYFARERVDVAVIEVGLGGRLDATNVINPEIALITSIELEHTHILGDTREAIATEKAGIVKDRVATVTGVTDLESIRPIEQICRLHQSKLWQIDRDFSVSSMRPGVTEQHFDLDVRGSIGLEPLRDLALGLAGESQCQNAALAAVSAQLLADRFDRIGETAIRHGLRRVRWPGRLQWIDHKPAVLLDVAHTPASAGQLRRYLDRFFSDRPKTLVIGMLRDKRPREIASVLAGAFDRIVVAPIKWFRTLDADQLQSAFSQHHHLVETAPTICSALEHALATTPPGGLVVVAGSLFAVGEVKRRYGW